MTHLTPAPEPDTDADATFRNWMRLNLTRAAEKFGLSVTGAPVSDWRLRSIGAVAHDPIGPAGRGLSPNNHSGPPASSGPEPGRQHPHRLPSPSSW
jgi:hypothetical protein